MAGYDLATGKELWHLGDGGDIPVPAPVIAGDLFVLTQGHSKSPIFVVRADARGDLTPSQDNKPEGLAWSLRVKGAYMPTPIVVGDLLYVNDDNGVFTAFEVANSKQVFRERLPKSGSSPYSASPVSAGGLVFTTNEDGQVDVIEAGRKFKPVAQNQMNEICMATPAIADGELFIRGAKNLYCIGGP
jgi:outer membrane protein assembly factor BamB